MEKSGRPSWNFQRQSFTTIISQVKLFISTFQRSIPSARPEVFGYSANFRKSSMLEGPNQKMETTLSSSATYSREKELFNKK